MARKALSKSKRASIYKELNGRCAYCGQLIKYDDMHVEHVNPLSQGGPDSRENMLPACYYCDTLKDNRNLEEFRNLLENILSEVLKKNLGFVVAERFGLTTVSSKPIKFYFETKGIKLKEM